MVEPATTPPLGLAAAMTTGTTCGPVLDGEVPVTWQMVDWPGVRLVLEQDTAPGRVELPDRSLRSVRPESVTVTVTLVAERLATDGPGAVPAACPLILGELTVSFPPAEVDGVPTV